MTWGAYSATWSNPVGAQSTTATADVATATATVTPFGYAELIQTPSTVTATSGANNASNVPISLTAPAGTASATGTAHSATTAGVSSLVAAGSASATASAWTASAGSESVGVPDALTVRIDWAKDGSFTESGDDVSGRLLAGASWTRGRNADLSGEATGSASFTLSNHDEKFTPDRNWHDNPSFEVDATGWSTADVTGLTAAATSISIVTDSAPDAGVQAGEAVLTGTVDSGVTYPIPYTFRAGVTHAGSVWLRSLSGTLTVRAGLASAGTPTDIASTSTSITTSWAAYPFTWTPSADRADAVFFVRTVSSLAATVRIDAVQVNPGATVNAYLEGPTKGQLVPGRPVHISATYAGTDYPQFYGFIQRIQLDPEAKTVTVTCYDQLKAFANTDSAFSVARSSNVVYTARDYRIMLLEEFERGTLNVAQDNNPSFEDSATAGWNYINYPGTGPSTLTRVSDTAPGVGGSWAGEWWASSTNTRLYLDCRAGLRFEAGTVYTASVWLKATSGTPTLTLSLGQDAGITKYNAEVVTLSTEWQQFTVRYVIEETVTASTDWGVYLHLIFAIWAHTTANFTVRVDGLMVNRGPIVAPFNATGTGRSPNWCSDGSFDGIPTGSTWAYSWLSGWANLCLNPSFETDTSGWSTTADAFHRGNSNIQRTQFSQTGAGTGTWSGYVLLNYQEGFPTGQPGIYYAPSGTFKAGTTYSFGLNLFHPYGGWLLEVGIGSNGTPTDYAVATITTEDGWRYAQVTWTPTADRTDVHAFIRAKPGGSGIFYMDGVLITEYDSQRPGKAAYSVTPLPYCTQGVASYGSSTTAKYGARSMSWTSLAVAGSGRLYDFINSGAYFTAGRPYTASLWLRPSSSMAYRVGFAGSSDYGATFTDKTSTSGTAPANVWTQVTLTWTPTANHPGFPGQSALIYNSAALYIEQTDATAREVLVDGVRVIPGSSADEYELPQWALGDEDDACTSGAEHFADTSIGSGLSAISGMTLARHWVSPTMAAPYYRYTTVDRDEQLALSSVEAYADDTFRISGLEIDLDTITNLVQSGTDLEWAYDQTSIDTYGQRPGAVATGLLHGDAMIEVGAAMLARRKAPRMQPTMTVYDRFPSQLAREVGDVVTLTIEREMIRDRRFSVLSLNTRVDTGGWTTSYVLEEL